MPKEVTQDVSKVTLVGERDLIIENYKGILEYDDKLVRIKTSHRPIKITGHDLEMRTITDEDVQIFGKIDSFEFI